MTNIEGPRPAVLGAGGVYLPPEVCHPLWLVLRAELTRRRADGGRVRPEITETLAALRAAGFAHLSAPGPAPGTYADIEPPSRPDLLTTAQLAQRLDVTERHARRLAALEGIEPAGRNRWHADDVAHLAARREGRPDDHALSQPPRRSADGPQTRQ